MSVIKGEVGERVGEWEYGSMARARRQGVGGAAKREQRDQAPTPLSTSTSTSKKKFIDVRAAALK